MSASPESLDAWTTERFLSIAVAGLKSGSSLSKRDQRLLATDPKSCTKVYGATIQNYPDESKTLDLLREKLYESDESIFPVLTERPNENNPLLNGSVSDELISMRAKRSLLVVCIWEKVFTPALKGYIPSSLFQGMIIPEELYSTFRVRNAQDWVTCSIVVADGFKEASLLWKFRKITVPDYEQPLLSLMKDTSNIMWWVHGVRLPTEEDLAGIDIP